MNKKAKRVFSTVQQIKFQQLQLDIEALWEQLQDTSTGLRQLAQEELQLNAGELIKLN
ncbi:MAG: hypothetical protein F6K58_08955 [Symploca sp. SIO2E9]|nr:hypothetical protein [Symploca sp. SIO2E9]